MIIKNAEKISVKDNNRNISSFCQISFSQNMSEIYQRNFENINDDKTYAFIRYILFDYKKMYFNSITTVRLTSVRSEKTEIFMSLISAYRSLLWSLAYKVPAETRCL
jgi:hypothetical protein